MTYPDGTAVNYTYDLLGRMTNVKDAEKQNTVYTYDAASQLIKETLPNGWENTYTYDLAGQLLRQYTEAPSKKANDSIEHKYTYDPQGNVLTEFRSGANGVTRFNLKHTYDALNRMLTTTGDQGYKSQTYTYDSLGNLIYEQIHNKGTEYKYNKLNQQIQKIEDGKDTYNYTFDKRGNLVKAIYAKSNSIIAQYTYDGTNRMVKGINAEGEESHYIYNGLGYLVANEWIVANNAYGYHGFAYTPSKQVDGVVTTCDAHDNTNGKGHINPTGAGHFKDKGKTNNGERTTGGTEDGILPKGSNKVMSIHKDYTIDYTSTLKNVIMEQEHGSGGLTYRYVYGLTKLSVTIHGIPNGVGSVAQSYDYPNGKESVVKLYYHRDRLFTTDYLTDNISGKITSFAEYDPWGAPLSKAIVRLGVRELDLVLQYTVHPYDQVLGLYFAQARMYDANGRRFISFDLYPPNMVNTQSFNRYLYVLDNPLVYVDFDGLTPELVEGCVIVIESKKSKEQINNVYVDTKGEIYIDFYEALKAYGFKEEELKGNKIYSSSGAKYIEFNFLEGPAILTTTLYTQSGLTFTSEGPKPVFKKATNREGSPNTSYIRGTNLIRFEYFKKLMCEIDRDIGKTATYKIENIGEAYKIMQSYLDEIIPDGFIVDVAVYFAASNGAQKTIKHFIKGGFQNDKHKQFDTEILAWTNFWNNRVATEEIYKHKTIIRPEVIKAMIAQESSMGTASTYNAEKNVMMSLFPGDSTLWIAAAIDPTERGKHHIDPSTGNISVNVKRLDGSIFEHGSLPQSYDKGETAAYGFGSGFGVLKNVIQTGGGKSGQEYMVVYKEQTPRMSIAIGIGTYAYKLNILGDGSERSGVNGYGPNSQHYLNINKHLRDMNAPEV